jgi:cell wall-associated NlpC family hydrolase
MLLPGTSLANVATKKIQVRPIKLTSASVTTEPVASKEKIKVDKPTPTNQAARLPVRKSAAGKNKAGRKFVKNGGFRVTLRERKSTGKRKTSAVSDVSSIFADVSGLEELRQYYQDWRGTRYRAGGSSHAGVDCSGFTVLAFRDVYGIKLPRTAREQAMRGLPVDRDSLLPGDLVFFKRQRGGDHVGIYLGNGKFMHASSHQGVAISSMYNIYWRNKFWKGSRLL